MVARQYHSAIEGMSVLFMSVKPTQMITNSNHLSCPAGNQYCTRSKKGKRGFCSTRLKRIRNQRIIERALYANECVFICESGAKSPLERARGGLACLRFAYDLKFR
jgi:hypothetical protein